MKSPVTLVAAVLALGAVCVFWQGGGRTSAVAGDVPVAAVSGATSLVLASGSTEYVGSTKCKKCHLPEYKSWEKLAHGTALETLKPGNKVEAKKKFNLDPDKDYSKDATCVGCHTTGFEKPGGFAIAADEEAGKKMKALEGVGCEACHGAGGGYLDLHDEIMKSKRKYKLEEMTAAGLIAPDEKLCVTCHNDKGPTYDAAAPFDFAKMKDKGVHEHVELKQRED